jgi:hypothetical protein
MKDGEAKEKMILHYMEAGNSITSMEAIEMFKYTRLPARICDFKKAGISVQDDWEYDFDERGKVVTKWKRYYINAPAN